MPENLELFLYIIEKILSVHARNVRSYPELQNKFTTPWNPLRVDLAWSPLTGSSVAASKIGRPARKRRSFVVVFGNFSSPGARIVCLTARKLEISSENRGMPVGTSGRGPSRG